MHDVTKSSNPDVQALVEMNRQLGAALLRFKAELDALRTEVDNLPEEYVVPGPNGEVTVAVRKMLQARAQGINAAVTSTAQVPADVSPLAAAGVV